MGTSLRRTPAMLDLLGCLLAATGPTWGLRLSKDSGRPTGTIYPLLERLETAGHVTSSWDDDPGRPGARRRLYTLTDDGRGWARAQVSAASPAGRVAVASPGEALA